MRPRLANQLKAMGYQGDVDEIRRVLAEVKAEQFPRLDGRGIDLHRCDR